MADSNSTVRDRWLLEVQDLIKDVVLSLRHIKDDELALRLRIDRTNLRLVIEDLMDRLDTASAILSNDTYVLADLAALVGVGADQADDFTASDVPHVADQ